MARTGREANPVPIKPERSVARKAARSGRAGSTLSAIPNRFYRRRWAENRGDEFAGWGHSVWYFEVGDDGWPVRQAETYDAGRVLRYGPNHSEEPSSLSVLRSLLGHVNRR